MKDLLNLLTYRNYRANREILTGRMSLDQFQRLYASCCGLTSEQMEAMEAQYQLDISGLSFTAIGQA